MKVNLLFLSGRPPHSSSLDDGKFVARRRLLAAHAADQEVLTHQLTLFEGLLAAGPGKRWTLRSPIKERSTTMQHVIQIPCKPWTLNGFSDRLMVSHYEDVYGAAVRSLNAI